MTLWERSTDSALLNWCCRCGDMLDGGKKEREKEIWEKKNIWNKVMIMNFSFFLFIRKSDAWVWERQEEWHHYFPLSLPLPLLCFIEWSLPQSSPASLLFSLQIRHLSRQETAIVSISDSLMNWYFLHPSVRMTTSIHRQLFGHTRIHHTCEDHTLAVVRRSAAPIPRYKREREREIAWGRKIADLSRLLWDWSEWHIVLRVEMISIQSFPESVTSWISSSHRPTATMRDDERPIESVTTWLSRGE